MRSFRRLGKAGKRRARVVALEENVIERDVLDADGSRVAVHFQHAVHQQHRVAMRQDALNPPNVQSRIAGEEGCAVDRLSLRQQLTGQQVIQFMTGFISDDPTPDRPANESQITENVQSLLTRAFVD